MPLLEIATYKYEKTAIEHMEDLNKINPVSSYRVTTNQRGRYVVEIVDKRGHRGYATKRKTKAT